jgi:hypothetical protein
VFTALCLAYLAMPQSDVDRQMLDRARKFLDALRPELRKEALQPFDSDSRTGWAFTPGVRIGVSWGRMSASESSAARLLLESGLSAVGRTKVEDIRRLERYLRETEGEHRDPDYYVFTVFGEPSASGAWGWRYEGHHVSLSYTVVLGRVVATTPQFMGANPAEVRSGQWKGLRALRNEEELGRALVRSLTDEQRRAAILSDRAPADIATGNQRVAAIQENKGVGYESLTAAQRRTLWSLIELHANVQNPELAKRRLAGAQASLEKVKFAWMGGTRPGEGHYYRVQGPTFLIEYDNTQNGANHIHCVWRDFGGDFGRDAIAEHYRASAHHQHRP